jgi:hypothetical protein
MERNKGQRKHESPPTTVVNRNLRILSFHWAAFMRCCISTISLGVILARASSAASCSLAQWLTSTLLGAPIEYVATSVPSSTSRFRRLSRDVSYIRKDEGRRWGHLTDTSGIAAPGHQTRMQAEYAGSQSCERQKRHHRHHRSLLAHLRIALALS